jgi:S1-C subfamily serine protease
MRRKNKSINLSLVLINIMLFGIIVAYLINESHVEAGHQVTYTTETTTSNQSDILMLEVRTKIEKSNVYIRTNYQSGYEYGSGVIIHEDNDYYYAITNEHIIDGNNNVVNSYEVITYDEISSAIEIRNASEELDLALIRFEKANRSIINPLSIVDNDVLVNDLVVSIGNPLGNIALITYGTIISITELNELELTHEVYEHNASLDSGSSGGALVDINGNLIGINTWRLNGVYYAIRGSVINSYIINNL